MRLTAPTDQLSTDAVTPLLRVRGLSVTFPTEDGMVRAVNDLSFDAYAGRTLAIVGESGSGKSVASLAIMGLLGSNATVTGQIQLGGRELLNASAEQVRRLRGDRMAMVFQDPLSSLHPHYTVGDQIVEAYRVHHRVPRRSARGRAIEMLQQVGIPDPRKRADDYPHQFSGGMRQRVMIAMALSCDPDLLIADEPTTALDVTVQAQILELLMEVQETFGSAIALISHDLGVVAEVADDVLVMYGGRVVEHAPTPELFHAPHHPYTWGLLSSIPRLETDVTRLNPITGSPPSMLGTQHGCPFQPRCPYASRVGQRCADQVPDLLEAAPEHTVACHLSPSTRQQVFTEEIRPRWA